MRILIVDDERQITRVLRTSLQSHGYDVQVAQDGLEAFTLFEQAPPDLIITDLIMPEKEGLQMIKELRRDYPQAKIIAMSGGGRTGTMNCLGVARAFGSTNFGFRSAPGCSVS